MIRVHSHFCRSRCFFFFFNDTATTEIYTLSLHDALPIRPDVRGSGERGVAGVGQWLPLARSEEHTSELQSPDHLVCRLLLEKKKIRDSWVCLSISMTRRQVDCYDSYIN